MILKNNRSSVVWGLLGLLAGVVILWPYLQFQQWLATGDHGRDLYCFNRTLHGDTPYRDYWWVYGPLMPYYYASVFALLGPSMKSALLGKLFLQWACGLVFFLAARLWIAPSMAFLATLWFWLYQPEFFFTYNHIGGILVLTGVMGTALAYIKKPNPRLISTGYVLCIFLALIKLNIGLSTLLAFGLSLGANDKINQRLSADKKLFHLKWFLSALAVVGVIYLLFLWGLPWHYLRQCFPYLKADHQYTSTISHALGIHLNVIFAHISESLPNALLAAIILFSGLKVFMTIFPKRAGTQLRKDMLSVVLAFIIFTVFNLHEFLNSGVFYRTFWIDAFKIFIMFFLIHTAVQNFPFLARFLLTITLLFVVALDVSYRSQTIRLYRQPSYFLPYPNAKIFVGNSPQWTGTVRETTDYLTSTLSPGETFLAIPYDPLYYFLTERQSPSRHIIFFDHINIHPSQEKEIIDTLERKKINYVLLTSRIKAKEVGLGTFGITYGPLLADYVFKNFEVTAVFGDWQNDPGWAWNHGTKILKRIDHP